MASGAQRFGGVVGNTVGESIPWWPDPVTPPPGSPNVVVIVLDDVGFADLGCFGSEIDTPNMDNLAAHGLRYNNFHTTAVCSPTRACLLTGRNHHSVGMAVVSNWDTGFPGWNELSAAEQKVAARMQQAYSGMLTHTDEHLGRLLATLREIGRAENTVFVLLSDNGATAEGGVSGHENAMRYINGLDPRPIDRQLADIDDIGGPNSWTVYPMGWAMAGNTPLKWYKQNTHAGGVRDPLIISWAAGINEKGAIRTQYHHVSDIAPTLLEAIGLVEPHEVAGVTQIPMEGTSMAYTFSDSHAPTAKTEQYYEMLGHRAMWAGGWKAVTRHIQGESFEEDRWELYHLDRDFSESRDLADAEPERLATLVDRWWAAARAHQVLPLDDRVLERFHAPKPRPITNRSRFVYYPGTYIPSDGCPDLKNVSYQITVELDRTVSDDGTLVACGDVSSGFALFIQNGRLVWDYNMAWEYYTAMSESTLPSGRLTVAATLAASSKPPSTWPTTVNPPIKL